MLASMRAAPWFGRARARPSIEGAGEQLRVIGDAMFGRARARPSIEGKLLTAWYRCGLSGLAGHVPGPPFEGFLSWWVGRSTRPSIEGGWWTAAHAEALDGQCVSNHLAWFRLPCGGGDGHLDVVLVGVSGGVLEAGRWRRVEVEGSCENATRSPPRGLQPFSVRELSCKYKIAVLAVHVPWAAFVKAVAVSAARLVGVDCWPGCEPTRPAGARWGPP